MLERMTAVWDGSVIYLHELRPAYMFLTVEIWPSDLLKLLLQRHLERNIDTVESLNTPQNMCTSRGCRNYFGARYYR